jgi:hypothetical protein
MNDERSDKAEGLPTSNRPDSLCSVIQEDQILVTQILEVIHNAGMYRERALAVLSVAHAHIDAMPRLAFV